MLCFRLRVALAPEAFAEASSTLRSLLGPVRAQPGCRLTRLLHDLDDDSVLEFVVEWLDLPDLEEHLHSPAFRRILAVMELACEKPQVEIDEIPHRWGMELVEQVLSVGPPERRA